MDTVIEITSIPQIHQHLLPHLVSFQVLDWQEADPVIAFLGKRVCLRPDEGWEWKYAT